MSFDGMSIEALQALQADLDQLERDDENVAAARKQLDDAIDRITAREREAAESAELARIERERKCEHCGVAKYTPHHETCPEYDKGPVREAGAYQYLNEDFEILHTTSQPKTDKEAIAYFYDVGGWFATSRLKYIWRRPMHEAEFKMMPFEWDAVNMQVTLIGGDPVPEGML